MKFSFDATAALFLSLALSGAHAQPRQTREEYIERYKSIAIADMERYGIPASITMAQGILESDSGNSTLSRTSNNHFGIKCKSTWRGARVYHDDDAPGECFRSYSSVEESYRDHAEFLDSSPRYDSLFAYPATDYRSWARGLKAAGYATAPDYAQRLVKIIEDYHLYLLDEEDGSRRYASYIASGGDPGEVFEAQSTAAPAVVGLDPDDFHVTVNGHGGYNVYRTNRTCYIIAKSGDTFRTLGDMFGISERTLRKFNDASRTAALSEGDMVYIERKKVRWEDGARLHVVREGDTLHSLSQFYGIRERSLARLNRFRRSRPLHAGETLTLG